MTKTLTKQTTQACVLDQQGKPLMPTTRLGKVYRLLKTQKAHIVSYEPFTIQLDYEPDTHVIQPMTLGVDSGAIHSGYSVANEHREYYSAEVISRDDISKRLSDRRMYRQNRRSRDTLTAEEFIKQTLPAKKAAAKLKQLPNEKRLFEYMAYMNATRWALYNAINEKYANVKMTYGYITKYNRIQAGLPKAHHIDAKCITGFATVPAMEQIVVKVKMRRHNRQLHRVTFSKGHVRKAACLPTVIFGFQLYDLVCFDNHYYYIKGRRSSGKFALVSVEGLKDTDRNYKKLTLLAHTNAYLTNRYIAL